MSMPEMIIGNYRQGCLETACMHAGNTLVFRQQQWRSDSLPGIGSGSHERGTQKPTFTIVVSAEPGNWRAPVRIRSSLKRAVSDHCLRCVDCR